MKLVASSGLWTTGSNTAALPLTAVLELDGAVLSWVVDDPAGADAAHITFTDPARADWLWRLVGESGHRAVAAAAARPAEAPLTVDLAGVDVVAGSLDRLRRLALGHWLRRWWPASRLDGIAELDRAILDAEIALQTNAAEEFFGDGTLDSGIAELVEPHAAALRDQVADGDPRVVDLVQACADLAEDTGVQAPGWLELRAALDDPGADLAAPMSTRRDDYALAAGHAADRRTSDTVAAGTASMTWAGVPPGVFDASDETIGWRIAESGSGAVAVIRTAILGPGSAADIPVRLRCGTLGAAGSLDRSGNAALSILDADGTPATRSAAWDHDWSTTTVTVGADVDEAEETRQRVRRYARRRLAEPAPDAYLAEVLAAEADY